MYRKIIAVILSATLFVCFAVGCGKGKTEEENNTQPGQTVSQGDAENTEQGNENSENQNTETGKTENNNTETGKTEGADPASGTNVSTSNANGNTATSTKKPDTAEAATSASTHTTEKNGTTSTSTSTSASSTKPTGGTGGNTETTSNGSVLPTLIVDSAACKKGGSVTVKVSVKNNPGILGMLVSIVYDEGVMQLDKVENGSAMSKYMFTPPKNMKSGCNAAWNINDIPGGELDGEILILHFNVSKKAANGAYPVSVSCENNAFDNNYETVRFAVMNGTVTVR